MSASTNPAMYRAQENTLARKKSEPMLPPNSGPSARLIMSEQTLQKSHVLDGIYFYFRNKSVIGSFKLVQYDTVTNSKHHHFL